jgi:hypothetical protein
MIVSSDWLMVLDSPDERVLLLGPGVDPVQAGLAAALRGAHLRAGIAGFGV